MSQEMMMLAYNCCCLFTKWKWFQRYRNISICTEHTLDYNGRNSF